MIGPHLTQTIVAQCLDECADLERDHGDGGLSHYYRERAAEIRRDAAEADRRTFVIPEGHEAVRDSNGRATGETRPVVPDDIRSAIPDRFLLDPPDGGDVPTVEGVKRMAARIAELERDLIDTRDMIQNHGHQSRGGIAPDWWQVSVNERRKRKKAEARDAGPYLIWSNQHRAWWRPNRQGYTTHLDAAGRYGRDEAIGIARGTRDGWTDRGRVPDEIAIREADVLEAASRAENQDAKNVGHGHVFPRPDGVRAKCGGPVICAECAADLARQTMAKAD